MYSAASGLLCTILLCSCSLFRLPLAALHLKCLHIQGSQGFQGSPRPCSSKTSSHFLVPGAMTSKTELGQAISILYSLDRSAEDRSRASQWLESFQQSSMAWQVITVGCIY